MDRLDAGSARWPDEADARHLWLGDHCPGFKEFGPIADAMEQNIVKSLKDTCIHDDIDLYNTTLFTCVCWCLEASTQVIPINDIDSQKQTIFS